MKYNNYKTTKRSKYNLLYQTVFKGVTKSLGNYGIYIVLESKGYKKEKKGNEEISSNKFRIVSYSSKKAEKKKQAK